MANKVKEPKKAEESKKGAFEVPVQVVLWNVFVQSLFEARENWEALKEEMKNIPLGQLPIEAQRVMRFTAISKASTFERMLMQFMQHWQRSGGLETMVININPEEERIEEE